MVGIAECVSAPGRVLDDSRARHRHEHAVKVRVDPGTYVLSCLPFMSVLQLKHRLREGEMRVSWMRLHRGESSAELLDDQLLIDLIPVHRKSGLRPQRAGWGDPSPERSKRTLSLTLKVQNPGDFHGAGCIAPWGCEAREITCLRSRFRLIA